MGEAWPRLELDRVHDDPARIGVWFDETLARLEQAQLDAAQLRADGRDAAANLLIARTLGQLKLALDDARMLARHLWREARRT